MCLPPGPMFVLYNAALRGFPAGKDEPVVQLQKDTPWTVPFDGTLLVRESEQKVKLASVTCPTNSPKERTSCDGRKP